MNFYCSYLIKSFIYNGIFPCFLQGRSTFFVWSNSKSSQSLCRVTAGSITGYHMMPIKQKIFHQVT